jgi:branched-chain amino acid transport system ATP-binding protein
VHLGGTRIDRLRPHARARLGIGRTFQRLELFSGLTTREHVLLAIRVRDRTVSLWRDLVGLGRASPAEQREADDLLGLTGLVEVAELPVEALGLGHGRLVELARALASAPRLLLLDEPSSGLDGTERGDLARLLQEIRRVRRIAVLLVEHDLDMVAAAAERLVVLDAGRVIADGPPSEVLADPAVREAYLGTGP